MRKFVAALGVAMLAWTTGCHSCGGVPTDLEPLYQHLQYHSPACEVYPYSCPCCPYFDYEYGVWRDPITGMVLPPQPQ